MAEKKRKGAASVPAPPTKKTKKSPASEPATTTQAKVADLAPTPASEPSAATKSKSSRKRAADFLGEEQLEPVAAPEPVESAKTKKAKKSTPVESASEPKKKSKKNTLTADGTNGVVEQNRDANLVIATSKRPASTSLEAEALRTVDKEIEEENASEDEDDQGAVLLAGFDSDNEDPAEDQGDLSSTQPIPQFKKTSKKLKQAKEKGSDGPGTVYVGRIPHGFYEQQMREYFSQFGTITKLRLSRNRRTGASKHFAFIEFESDEVAKIVADTMDNYLMFGHILKCKYAPSENLHPDVWKGANKKYRKIPHKKLARQQLEAPKTQEQWTKKNEKETKKRLHQAEKLKAIGYEYVVPELKDPASVVKDRKAEEEHGIPPAKLTNENEPDAIEPPPPVPADEVALKKKEEKKSKKLKPTKSDGKADLLTQGNLDARNAGPAAETAKMAQNVQDEENNVPIPAPIEPKKTRNSKASNISAPESSHNEYENLSSIPVGIEAAPASVTDAIPETEFESIFTLEGVADAVLAGRKKDRRKLKTQSSKRDKQRAAAEVSDMAPGAVYRGRQEMERDKKLKGILRRT